MTAAPAPAQHPIDQGYPPEWAVEWGEDRYGVFASFEVEGVQQRMRWIPPGRFWMGSPVDEAGRYGDEGPRHLVELTEGFWLADTPCTQELWVAVMGNNPGQFQSPQRPVERVSWEDCQAFFTKLTNRDALCQGRLPTEAEWEYACRAGTVTATWVGDLEILGANNAPLLDDIAWYGGNSGKDYDLKKGVDSSGWQEKQYDHARAGTREVRLKQRNPWGLHDMLGNVYEWCSDWDGNYLDAAVTDPTGPTKGSHRLIRGGSWHSDARDVRAAYRSWVRPSLRHFRLGFRFVLEGRGASSAASNVGQRQA